MRGSRGEAPKGQRRRAREQLDEEMESLFAALTIAEKRAALESLGGTAKGRSTRAWSTSRQAISIFELTGDGAAVGDGAAATSCYFIFSLFPFLPFVVALIAYLPLQRPIEHFRMTLSGFRSLCTIPRVWAAVGPAAISR